MLLHVVRGKKNFQLIFRRQYDSSLYHFYSIALSSGTLLVFWFFRGGAASFDFFPRPAPLKEGPLVAILIGFM